MLTKAKEGIKKAELHLEHEFSKLQVWRANPSLVEEVRVDSYGSLQPVQNLATVWVLDSQTISIKPWDKWVIHSIAKAITDAGLGLNPQTMADSILIKVPPLTEERRKEIVKIAKRLTEEAKVSIRNVRADSMKDIKNAEDNKEISEDARKDLESDLQDLVNAANKKCDELLKIKETDLMKV